ncbi:uncharacterized protein LOC110062758 [Orbicella faveolata]|uniref:uncharacterized protein LOC110062758 n=1 Tax=Orbicella faveolata TaxID=48498 RepID=UPI0009E3A5F4|nr:uncharacterized protein LOC110062758 [Orbicella faveolata]
MLTQLSSGSTDTKVAVATYATSRRISCFGRTKQAISYIDNEYQHAGKGLNLLNLALSKMIMKQFDKRPDDRQTRDTAKVLVIFSDGNAQNENGDIMDTSILKQTAGSLQYNLIEIFGVLIPNTEKASRIQELEGIVSYPYEVIDASFNSIADLLAFRVKRMVDCLVKYTVKVYTRDSHARSDYGLTVRIEGQGKQKTANQSLFETTQDRENNLHVIVSAFYDLDVGTVERVNIQTKRFQSASPFRAGWNLKEVT